MPVADEAAAWVEAVGGRSPIAAPGVVLRSNNDLRAMVSTPSDGLLSYYEWSIGRRPIDVRWDHHKNTIEAFSEYRASTVKALVLARRKALDERGLSPVPSRRPWRRFLFLESMNDADGAAATVLPAIDVCGVPACDYWIATRYYSTRSKSRTGDMILPEIAIVCVCPDWMEDALQRAMSSTTLPCLVWDRNGTPTRELNDDVSR